MKKVLFSLAILAITVAFATPSFACYRYPQCNHYSWNDNRTFNKGGDGGDATAYGGTGIGIGGDATIEKGAVKVDNKNTNVNLNSNENKNTNVNLNANKNVNKNNNKMFRKIA